jgi:hypothetical protein
VKRRHVSALVSGYGAGEQQVLFLRREHPLRMPLGLLEQILAKAKQVVKPMYSRWDARAWRASRDHQDGCSHFRASATKGERRAKLLYIRSQYDHVIPLLLRVTRLKPV